MAYVRPDYTSKKRLRDDVKAGRDVQVFQPGLGDVPVDGTIALEGPHFPKPHTWYAVGTMKAGKLVDVK